MEKSLDISESRLASLYAKGDSLAKRELYTRYATVVHALCRRYLSDPDEAKDMTHDIILKVFDSIGGFRFRGEGSLMAWISRIAVNSVINNVTRSESLVRMDIQAMEAPMREPTDDEMTSIPLPTLLGLISEIPPTQRMILNLYCLDGYSHKEIAGLMGITEKASSSLLSKAKKLLAEKIDEYYMNKG